MQRAVPLHQKRNSSSSLITADSGGQLRLEPYLLVRRRGSLHPFQKACVSMSFVRSAKGCLVAAPDLSIIFNSLLTMLVARWGNLFGNFAAASWFTPARVASFAERIHAAKAPLTNCWGFIDGTIRPICSTFTAATRGSMP